MIIFLRTKVINLYNNWFNDNEKIKFKNSSLFLIYSNRIIMSKKKKRAAWGENGFEDWGGYMAAKQSKLEEQFHCEANKNVKTSSLFEGIAIFVNGYTDPTADELRRLMMEHGGTYHHYMRPRITTHIIASNLPYSKIVLYRKSQNPVPICKPKWITDSIKVGRLLNFQNYLLYSQCTDVQPQLNYITIGRKEETNGVTQKSAGANINNQNKSSPAKHTAMKSVDLCHSTASVSGGTHPTKNSQFISDFYSLSRLHHIATMGATFKDYVNELREKSNGHFPGLAKLKELKNTKLNRTLSDSQLDCDIETAYLQEELKRDISLDTIIMHIDMDCFFVSVGLRDKPHLKGLPVAVTHAKGNKTFATNNKQTLGSDIINNEEHGSLSEVASCSYEARQAGVKNGMFLGEALKICPNLQTIPYDFEGYTEVSYALYNTVALYTLDIEAVSCDEMYADCTKMLVESGLTPMEFASVIREEIKDKTGCPVSAGFGGNKLLARLATRKAKPNGQFFIQPEQINNYISAFNVQDLPGVGWTTTHKLNSMNVRTCVELQVIPLVKLQKEFGKKTGEMLYNMCRGIDNSKLNLEHVRKSVSAEVNYGIRFQNNEDAIDFLRKLSREVCNRLNKANAKGRCITLKLLIRAKEAPKETEKFMGHGLCDYVTKSQNFMSPINDVDIITKEVITLWNQMQKVPEDARGIGIQISRLEVLKNKSRNATLLNFVKNKESSTCCSSNKTNEPIKALANSNAVSLSSNGTVRDEQILDIRCGFDKSVIAELPEEIRHEILNVSVGKGLAQSEMVQEIVGVQKVEEKTSKKNVHVQQELFFKQTKPGVSRTSKVEMPSIQEIDMAVLIELPEDIRNEILNEYSAKTRENQKDVNTNRNKVSTSSDNHGKPFNMNYDEQNISFSQVDPEFLAALSDELKRDVQLYCNAKKVECCAQSKREEANRNLGLVNIKRNKKIEHRAKSKNSGKNAKTVAKGKTKSVQGALKTKKVVNDIDNIGDKKAQTGLTKLAISYVAEVELHTKQISADETQSILSHNRTISESSGNIVQHQDILIQLVNRLLNLPLEQVATEIQTWIENSKTVNEVDFLSLATFLSMLPEKRRIEDLHVLLKTMHRCMTKTGNCIWHRTYRKTVKYVQHYMQIEYNSNLMVPAVKCNLSWCNSGDVM